MMKLRSLVSVVLLISLLGWGNNSYCQTARVSFFRQQFYGSSALKDELAASLAICGESHSIGPDSLYYYCNFARIASEKLHSDPARVLANVFSEVYLSRRNLFDSALALCHADLKRLSYRTNGDGYSRTKMQECYALMKSNRNKEALENCYHFLAEAGKQNDTAGEVFTQLIIGTVYRNMQQTEAALAWFDKANATTTDTAYEKMRNEFGLYFDLGLMYNWEMDLHSGTEQAAKDSLTCLAYLDRSIRDSRRFENLGMLARALNIKAATIGNKQHLAEEGVLIGESEKIYAKLHDTISMLNAIAPRAFYYIDAGETGKAIAICKKGISLSASGKGFPVLDLYETLEQSYQAAGDLENYAATLRTMIRIKDSLYRINSERDLAELNARYDDQQKQNIIISQKLDIASKRNTMLVVSTVAVILAVGILFLYFYFDREKRTQRLKQTLAIASAEEAERKRISADLHDNIGAYAAAAASTIATIRPEDHAQTSKLDMLRSHVQDMIIQLNDSIWALNKKEVQLTAVSDRFKSFVQKLENTYPSIMITIEEEIPKDRILSPFHGLHLYRIMQEGLNNALRHSRCTEILVRIDSDVNAMQVSIADNGIGMMNNNPVGNGLNNLRIRAKESGWQIEWINSEQKGVTMILKAGATTN